MNNSHSIILSRNDWRNCDFPINQPHARGADRGGAKKLLAKTEKQKEITKRNETKGNYVKTEEKTV